MASISNPLNNSRLEHGFSGREVSILGIGKVVGPLHYCDFIFFFWSWHSAGPSLSKRCMTEEPIRGKGALIIFVTAAFEFAIHRALLPSEVQLKCVVTLLAVHNSASLCFGWPDEPSDSFSARNVSSYAQRQSWVRYIHLVTGRNRGIIDSYGRS